MRYKEAGKRFCEEINAFCESIKLRCALVIGGGYSYDSIKYVDDEVQNKDFDFMIVYENSNDIEIIISNLKYLTQFEFEEKYLVGDIGQVEDGKIDIIRLSGKYRLFKATINLVPFFLVKKIALLQEYNIRKIAHGRNTSLFFANSTNGNRITTIFFAPFFRTKDGELHYVHLDFTCKKEQGHLFLGILADAVLKGFSKQYDNIGFHDLRAKLIKNIYNYLLENGTENYQYEALFANWNYFSDSVKQILISEFYEINQIDNREICSLLKQNPKTYFLFERDFIANCSPFDFIYCKTLNSTLKQYILLMQNSEYTRQYLIDAWGKFLAAVYYEYVMKSNETFMNLKKYDWNKEVDKYVVYGVNDIYYNANDALSCECLLYFLKWIFSEQVNLNYEFIICITNMTIDFFDIILGINIVKFNEFWDNQEIDFLNRISERKVIHEYAETKSFEEIAMLHNLHSKVMEKYTQEEVAFLSKYFVDKQEAILDVMCGAGRIANELRKLQYDNVYGIDQYDYKKLGVKKDFKFMKCKIEDFFTNLRFKYIVCLYNCYSSTEELRQLLEKIYELSKEDTVVIIDIFNKRWRENTDVIYHHVLETSKDYVVELTRKYNSSIEKTIYNILKGDKIVKSYAFQQKFFDEADLQKVFSEKWNFKLVNSKEVSTRNNNQKLIYILTKKDQWEGK